MVPALVPGTKSPTVKLLLCGGSFGWGGDGGVEHPPSCADDLRIGKRCGGRQRCNIKNLYTRFGMKFGVSGDLNLLGCRYGIDRPMIWRSGWDMVAVWPICIP